MRRESDTFTYYVLTVIAPLIIKANAPAITWIFAMREGVDLQVGVEGRGDL